MPIAPRLASIGKIFGTLAAVAALVSQTASAQDRKADLDNRLALASETLNEIMATPDKAIPTGVLAAASCIVVIPSYNKGAFVGGTQYGQGVSTCRTQKGWSAPSFVKLEGNGFGFQVAGQTSDLVLVSTDSNGLQNLEKDKLKIGADTTASAGPVGRDAQATDWKHTGQMLTYSRSKGVFAGVNLDGATLSSNESSVRTYYGSRTTPAEVLAGNVPVNSTGIQFVQSVSRYFGGKSVNASTSLPGSSTTLPDNPNYQVVRIFFATDRALGKRSADMQIFTGARSASENFSLGQAEISIPRDHQMGELEHPSLLRLEFRPDPEKHIVLLKSKVLTTNAFQAALGDKLKGDAKHRVLVFVHGYNVSFEDAARRLGQMTYDLGFSGAPILYSWPSRGTPLAYGEDEASVEWSIPHFTAFLRSLHLNPDVQTIYVVGHSMGNRLVTNSLRSLASDNPTQPAIRDVIMAAPDIDEGVFRQAADTLLKAASRITIYESSNDNALVISHHYHGYARLGDTNPTVHVLSRYECIEASSLKTDFLGHSYIGDSSSIMADVYDLMANGLSASKRFRLVEHQLDGLPYWSFKP